MAQHKVLWLLIGTQRWHAWYSGGRSTACGRINVEHLRQRPASRIESTPPPEAAVCRTCATATGYAVAVAASADATTSAWIGTLGRHFAHQHVTVSAEIVKGLAAALAQVGPPNLPAAAAVFTQLQALLFRPTYAQKASASGQARRVATLPHLKAAVTALQQPQGAAQRVAEVLSTWQRLSRRDVCHERFRPDHVVGIMLAVPDAEAYIKHFLAKDLPNLAVIFHPSTFERAKKDPALRGLFSGTSTYWESTISQLNIVTE